ncbi:MAG: glycosyltransferase family 2 protein [Patescibacteria group bacterium]
MKLSIIIPCYNCVRTLEEAVASAYRQDLDIPFEVVLVDDGSTDNTRKLIVELAKKNSSIKYFWHDKNLGGGAARNTAISSAEGDVIFCLDSDDVLPDGTLSKMIKFLKEKRCDGVTIDRSVKFSGNNIHNIHHIEKSPYPGGKIQLASLLSKNKNFSPLYVNFLYTKSAFNKTGGYPTSHGYDTQGFAWRFLCAGLSAYTCPDSEYLHRIHFNESYFMREYNNGKMNYNWRDIFLEHYYIFNNETLSFICTFDCSDFTKNIMDELINRDNILISNYESTFGKIYPPLQIKFSKPTYIKRNSTKGYYLRIKYKLKKILCKK